MILLCQSCGNCQGTKVHIALVTSQFWMNTGVGTSVREWASYLSGNGYEVSVFASDVLKRQDDGKLRFFKIYDIPLVPQVLFYFLQLFRLHNKQKIDVVHTHDSIAFFASYMFGKITKTPNIFTFHASIFSQGSENAYGRIQTKIFKITNRFAARYADKLICVSKEMIKCARFAGAADNKLILFYNPIDLSLFYPCKIKMRKNEKICLYVGTLRPEKGIEYFVEAIPKVMERICDVKFIIVGNGPIRNDLDKLIKAKKIEQSVNLVGHVPRHEIVEYYQKADVLVMPSLREAQGIVALESMACGLPIIASNIGGIPEIVKDNFNGFLVPPANISALSDAIVKVLSNPDLRRKLSNNAIDSAKEFSWRNNIERINKVYIETINRF